MTQGTSEPADTSHIYNALHMCGRTYIYELWGMQPWTNQGWGPGFIMRLISLIEKTRLESTLESISFLPRFMPFVNLVSSLLPYEVTSKVVSSAFAPRKLAWSKYAIVHIMFIKMSSATVEGFICLYVGCVCVMLQFLTKLVHGNYIESYWRKLMKYSLQKKGLTQLVD